jgi:hypothetical protein
MISRLLRAGGAPIEASNLAALAVGLGPAASSWSILETERLRSLQHVEASGEVPG